MKRCFTYLMVALLICSSAFAQTISTQGVPRQINKRSIQSSPATIKCDVDFDKITRWVGTGPNTSALVIKWNDGKDGNRKLVWGYRWKTSDNPTGETMLHAVAAADPYFYLLLYGATQYGAAIGGMGYDLNENGINYILSGSTKYKVNDGIASTSSYNFDSYTSPDVQDHWQSGWYKGYWSYWVANDADDDYQYSSVGATSRNLSDESVDGWSYITDMSNWYSADMSGTLNYLSALPDYTKGTFIVNEGWYGHENASINFLSSGGQWTYRVLQKENPGVELGATSDYGTIYGNKFYLISKQEKDPGATITGARITVCNAKTMKVLKQIPFIAQTADGKSACDGRSFLGVDEDKGYVGTSNGIYIMDLNTLEITGSIPGSGNAGGNDYAQLYSAQIGNMVRINDKVFAVHQKNGLLIIDAKADTIMRTISGPDGWQFGSAVLSKDGNLWLSIANSSGNGEAGNFIMKLNPATLDTTRINVPSGIYGPANSWYAWTPDGFCASTRNNILYWNGGANSWFSNKSIFKYDIDKNEFRKFIDLSGEDWQMYGSAFRIDPVTDNAYIGLFKDFSDPTYLLRAYNDEGQKLADYPLINNYWFPELPVFPDTQAPVFAPSAAVNHSGKDAFSIPLTDLGSDADNMSAAMIKSIKNISNTQVLSAQMENGNLIIKPLQNGSANITIHLNSNGKLADTDISVIISDITGITTTSAATLKAAFVANGQLHINGCDGFSFNVYNVSGTLLTSFKADNDNFTLPFAPQDHNTWIIRGNKDKENVTFKILVH
ncbi:MAG: DUF5074 domain-containing protein [Bacteroidaceae bacterium]